MRVLSKYYAGFLSGILKHKINCLGRGPLDYFNHVWTVAIFCTSDRSIYLAVFIEHLQYARHCAKLLGLQLWEMKTDPVLQEAYSLKGEKPLQQLRNLRCVGNHGLHSEHPRDTSDVLTHILT